MKPGKEKQSKSKYIANVECVSLQKDLYRSVRQPTCSCSQFIAEQLNTRNDQKIE